MRKRYVSRPVVCRPGGVSKSLKSLCAAAGQGHLAAAAEELVSPELSLHVQHLGNFNHTHISFKHMAVLSMQGIISPRLPVAAPDGNLKAVHQQHAHAMAGSSASSAIWRAPCSLCSWWMRRCCSRPASLRASPTPRPWPWPRLLQLLAPQSSVDCSANWLVSTYDHIFILHRRCSACKAKVECCLAWGAVQHYRMFWGDT